MIGQRRMFWNATFGYFVKKNKNMIPDWVTKTIKKEVVRYKYNNT